MLLLLGLCCTSVWGTDFNGPEKTFRLVRSVQRINYGIVFKAHHGLILSNEYWRHTYEIPLPNIPEIHRFGYLLESNKYCSTMSSHSCNTFQQVLFQLQQMQLTTRTSLQHVIDFITGNVPHVKMSKRVKKSLLPFVGGLSKTLFGTATMDDVNVLKAHINALTQNARNIGTMLKTQTHHISSFMQTANHRMDNLQSEITGNFHAITNLTYEISNELVHVESALLNISSLYFEQLVHAEKLIREFNNFKASVATLIEGRLTPSLISRDVLRHSISQIQTSLTKDYQNFFITMTDPDYYFRHGQFVLGRHNNSLFVTMKFPISHEKQPLQLFEIISMPVPVNNTSNHATQLLDLPKFLAITSHQQYYLELQKDDIALCRKHHYYICNFNKALKPVTKDSCVMGLFSNNKVMINKLCNFRFVPNLLSSAVVELSPDSAIVYNSYNLEVECRGNKTTLTGCSMCIINLPCQCSVTTQEWYFPPRLVKCQKDTKFDVFFPVNLALLQQFFNESKLITLSADSTFDKPANVVLPGFQIYQHSFQSKLADDTTMHLNMKKMVNATKHDEQIFQNLAEPLLDGLLNFGESWPSTNDILTYCTIGLTGISLIGTILLFLKFRRLAAMFLLLRQTHIIESTNPSYVFRKPSTETPTTFLETLQTTLKWEHFILAFTILTFFLTIVIIIRLCRQRRRGTTILLELTSGVHCATVPLITLPLCPTFLKVVPPTDISNISVAPLPLCSLLADWTDFKIINKLNDSSIDIPNKITISFWNRIRIMKVMKQPYTAYVLLGHDKMVLPLPNSNDQTNYDYFQT